MEAKQVPWWRKALHFALNSIRSGFGLFSSAQKDNAEIEPETVAGREKIREEEIELTEHSPEQESRVERAEVSEAAAAPDAVAAASATDIAAAPETAGEQEQEAGPQIDEQANSGSEAAIDNTAPVPAAEPEPENESGPELPAEAFVPPVAPEPETEPEMPIETAEAVEQVAEETSHEDNNQLEEAADIETEVASANGPPVSDAPEPVPEAETATQETQVIVQPEVEIEAAESEVPAEETPEVEASLMDEEASAPGAAAEAEAADEPVESAAEEAELMEQESVTEIEDSSAEEEETAAPEAATAPEMPLDAEFTEVSIADEATAEEEALYANEPEPGAEPNLESAQPAIKAVNQQVTEPQETVENDPVDEVALQAESAISEDSTPESASPLPDEPVEHVEQATDEKIEEPDAEASDRVNEECSEPTAEQADEPGSEQNEQGIAEEAQAVEQPMELNRPNPEPSAEMEETAEVAPVVAAEPEIAVDASAATPSTASDAEPSAEASEDAAAPAVEPVAAHPSKPFIKLEPREGETNVSPFSVIVSQVYDGPLDLLLDLIRKQDIDIYDIPIARITAQFLAYVNQLKASDVDVAGEFIYTASLLIHIKSKMLLPRAPSGPEEAAEDPRRELVERLLEHERFKNAAQMLQQKQMLEAATWTNPGVRDFKEDAGAEPEIAADTVDLVRVFREILDRARNRPVLDVQEDSVTVGQMIKFLSRRLTMEDKPVALRKLLSHTRSERALIAMFLALLELVRLQAILLRQDRAFSEIFIKKHTDFETVMNQGLARDDWQ